MIKADKKPPYVPKRPGTGRGRNKGQVVEDQHPTCKCTPEITKEFADILRKGNFRYTAIQRLGISKHTYTEWIATGRKQIRELEEGKRTKLLQQGLFVLACDEAEGWVHGKLMEDILKADSTPAKMWFLEKRFAKLYRDGGISLDDESMTESKVDAKALLLDKLLAIAKKGDAAA